MILCYNPLNADLVMLSRHMDMVFIKEERMAVWLRCCSLVPRPVSSILDRSVHCMHEKDALFAFTSIN